MSGDYAAQAIVQVAIAQSTWGQLRVANELRKQTLTISPAGDRCFWLRHDLQPMRKRLKALEAKVAQEGLALIEAQVVALARPPQTKQPMANSRAMSWLLWRAGYFLCRDLEGHGPDP